MGRLGTQEYLLWFILSVALSLDGQTGNFEVGKDFDALRVNVAAPGGPMDLFGNSEEPKVGNGGSIYLQTNE